MFRLLKELTTSRTLKKVLVREEARHPITKHVNSISLIRTKDEKSVGSNGVVGEDMVKPNKSDLVGTLKEVDGKGKVENRTNNELDGNTKDDLKGEKVRELVETPRFNDSLLAMQSGKMECKAYHSLPIEPMRKAMLKKMITKKEDIGGNFVIPCNVGGLKYIDALVDQGSNVNVMLLSTYNRLTNKKLVETDIRLSLASQSHIQPLGIAKDVLVEIEGFIYTMDFLILYIKEDRRKPFTLGTPFLTTAEAEIRFDKWTITLKSRKRKTNFGKYLKFLCIFKEREYDKFNPVTPTSTINKLILEREERIKLHQEKEKDFSQWRSKVFIDKCFILVSKGQKVSNEGGVT
ncbi:MAK10-like protein [Tanacetum coccineum]